MIANLGPDGGVYRLTRDGTLTLELDAVDGRKLPSTNFVNRDAQGRLWVSVSTWHDLAIRLSGGASVTASSY